MKRTLVILFLIIAFKKETKAQTYGVPDTLAYLQSIVSNKSHFIGHSFSVLMDSLQIQIKHFSRNTDIVYDIRKETSTSFGWYFPQNPDEIYLTYPRLRISWQTPLNALQSGVLYSNNNGGGWTLEVLSFYANAIISDIQIIE